MGVDEESVGESILSVQEVGCQREDQRQDLEQGAGRRGSHLELSIYNLEPKSVVLRTTFDDRQMQPHPSHGQAASQQCARTT